jgi:hypothetical protein
MAELDRTIVSIRFSGQGLDPKELGEMLGFIEAETTKSTIKRLNSGNVIWSIRFEAKDTSSLEEKIEALLAIFTKEIYAWIHATENVKAEIFCGLFLDSWNQGFSLTPNLIREIADRNLEIGFDIYPPTNSWAT